MFANYAKLLKSVMECPTLPRLLVVLCRISSNYGTLPSEQELCAFHNRNNIKGEKTMKNHAGKRFTRVIAFAVSLLLIASCVPLSGLVASAYRLNDEVVLEDVNFDENNINLRLGVMSDMHLSYASDPLASIQAKIANYAKASLVLDKMAGGKLDALMLCGDYTSHGREAQGRTFISASKAVMDAVNQGKSDSEKTKWIMAYGNHDTEWNGNMTIAQWESLFNEYGMLEDVEAAPGAIGAYKLTLNKGDKTYYVFSIETDTYNVPSNMFRVDVLEWLDAQLATASSDDYVYVISHGPIKESLVFGSDTAFEKGADWGTAETGYTGTCKEDGAPTTSDIDALLKKYPNVVYFSGHTHLTDVMDSSLMQTAYTAINVGQLHSSDFYMSKTDFLDDDTGNKPTVRVATGYSLFIEVDAAGNMRVTRVKNAQDFADVSIEYDELHNNDIEMTVRGSGDPEYISAAYVKSITVNSVSLPDESNLDDGWLLPAPKADKSHLRYFSKERACTPVFADSASVTVEDAVIADGKFKGTVTFDTATSPTIIHRYEVNLYSEDGTLLGTRWAAGNWIESNAGIVNSGETHLNATKLTYTVTFDTTANSDAVKASIVAVDEFGGRSREVFSDVTSCTSKLYMPVYDSKYTNYFDNIAAVGLPGSRRITQSGTKFSWDNVSVSVTDGPWDKVHFFLDPVKFAFYPAGKSDWNAPYKYHKYFTPFGADATFAYEADFYADEFGTNGYINFGIRMDGTTEVNKNLYTGVRVNKNGTYLMLNGSEIASNNAFKLAADGNVHHITVVSEPQKISVWIDGNEIFSRVRFTNGGVMYPTAYIWGELLKGYVDNQKMYDFNNLVPGYKVQQDKDFGPLTKNFFDGAKLVYNTSNSTGIAVPTSGFNSVTASVKDTSSDYGSQNILLVLDNPNAASVTSASYSKVASMSSFKATDEVAYEFEYTASNFYTRGNRKYAQFYLPIRTNGSEVVNLLIRSNGAFGLFVAGKDINITGGKMFLNDGETHKIKVVSTNTQMSLWIDDSPVYENLNFQDAYNAKYSSEGRTLDTDNYLPMFGFTDMQGADFKFDKIKIYKSGVTVKNYGEFDESKNLVRTAYANVTAAIGNAISGFTWNGYEMYMDMRYASLASKGYPQYRYYGNTVQFFGLDNSGYTFDSEKAYAFSMIVKKSNNSTAPVVSGDQGMYTSRLAWSFGTYNGNEVWCFYQDGTLYAYAEGSEVGKVTVGIGNNEYFRYTAVMTQFGYEIYMNGILVYKWTATDTSLFKRNPAFRVNGTEAMAQEIAIYEVDNTKGIIDRISELADANREKIEGIEGAKYVVSGNLTNAKAVVKKADDMVAAYNAGSVVNEADARSLLQEISALEISCNAYNNFIFDGSASIGLSSYINTTTTDGSHGYGSLPIFIDGKCPIAEGEVYVAESDIKVKSVGTGAKRIGFTTFKDANGDVMIQGSTQYTNTKASGWNASYGTTNGTRPDFAVAGFTCHVKFTVTPGVGIRYYMTSLDGKTLYYDYTAPWDVLRDNSRDPSKISPRFYFANMKVELSNIYAGYVLEHYNEALQTVLEKTAVADINSYVTASADAYKTALADAMRISAKYDDYSKSEIVAAGNALANAYNALEAKSVLDVTVAVGTDTAESFKLVEGDELPRNERIGTKFILSWKNGDETYEGKVASGLDLSADYVETQMMTVKYQLTKGATADSDKLNCRFIASVDGVSRYNSVGWLFSLTNPDMLKEDVGQGVADRESTKVYERVIANGNALTPNDVYGKDYAKYFYAFEIKNIPQSQYSKPIYVRAYVTMEDGTVVYGDTKTVVLSDILN